MSDFTGIPGLAGICAMEEAVRIGIPVEENIRFLKRLNYIKTRLYEIQAKHMNSTPEWEVKGAFSLHLWLDSEHAAILRKRVTEMRQPPTCLDRVPDERLEKWLDEAIHARTTVELLTGIYCVIRPALLAAYREHLERTNPLVDHPTCRILKFMALEEEEMLKWGALALQAVIRGDGERRESEAWAAHLSAFLRFAQGVWGAGQTEEASSLPAPRGLEPYEADYTPRREARFKDLFNSVLTADEVYLDRTRTANERVWALMYKRLREIDVPEMQCAIAARTKGKPWAYYNDMARQIWDEARHSMMGEVAFAQNGIDWRKLPVRINFSYELNLMVRVEESHAVLYDIEFGLMPGDTGKKYEWEVSKESGYELAAMFQDYDWADEVLHAQIGRRWIVKELGGVEQTLALAAQARDKMKAQRPEYISEDPHWWRNFYDQVKDRGFAGGPETT